MSRRPLSDRRIHAGRLSVYLEPRDLWIGLYIAEHALYFCLLTLVFRWERAAGKRRRLLSELARDELARLRAVRDQQRRDLLDALGMDPLRDWDDIINAARCMRVSQQDRRAKLAELTHEAIEAGSYGEPSPPTREDR